jgi:hypothetical protein
MGGHFHPKILILLYIYINKFFRDRSRDNNLYAEDFCRQIARKYFLHFCKRKENGKVNENN